MTDTYSTLDRYEIQPVGANPNSWGLITNNNLTLIEQNIDGYVTIDFSTTAVITASTNNGTPDQARCQMICATGTPLAPITLIMPNSNWSRIIINDTVQPLLVKTAVSIGTTTVPPMSNQRVWCDGINSDTFTVNLPVATTSTAGIVTVGSGINVTSGVISISAPTVFNTGMWMGWTTATPPSGWLLCQGQAISRVTYAALFGIIGTIYGNGDGSTTFNIPNFNGLVPAGVGANGITLASTIGASTVTLSTANLASHNHSVTDPNHTHTVTDPTHYHGVTDPTHRHNFTANYGSITFPGASNNGPVGNPTPNSGLYTAYSATGISINAASTGISIHTAATGITTANNGSGTAFSIMNPSLGTYFIIKT